MEMARECDLWPAQRSLCERCVWQPLGKQSSGCGLHLDKGAKLREDQVAPGWISALRHGWQPAFRRLKTRPQPESLPVMLEGLRSADLFQANIPEYYVRFGIIRF